MAIGDYLNAGDDGSSVDYDDRNPIKKFLAPKLPSGAPDTYNDAAVATSSPSPAPSVAPQPAAAPVVKVDAPKAPTAPEIDPAYKDLYSRKAQLETPTDKTDPRYRLGIGGKIMRGVADLFNGGVPGVLRDAVDPNAPGYYGKGAVNSQYSRDEAARVRNLNATEQQIADAKERFGLETAQFKNEDEAFKQAALARERDAKADRYAAMTPQQRAAAVGEVEGTIGRTLSPEDREYFILNGKVPPRPQPKENKTAGDIKERTALADQLKLKEPDRTYYILNGKLREPNPEAEARLNEAREARAQREADRQTREDDMNFNRTQAAHQRWTEKKAEIERDQERGYKAIEDEFEKKHGSVMDAKDSDPTKQAALAELNQRKAQHEKAIQARFAELGPDPAEARQQRTAATKPAATQSAPAAPASQPETFTYKGKQMSVGQTVMVGGKPAVITGFNKKTGKPTVR